MSVDHQDGLVCSFCGKSEDMVRKLVAYLKNYIISYLIYFSLSFCRATLAS